MRDFETIAKELRRAFKNEVVRGRPYPKSWKVPGEDMFTILDYARMAPELRWSDGSTDGIQLYGVQISA